MPSCGKRYAIEDEVVPCRHHRLSPAGYCSADKVKLPSRRKRRRRTCDSRCKHPLGAEEK